MNPSINRYLDHAVLKPELSRSEARDAIRIGIEYEVKTVCVRPCDIALAAELCAGTVTGVSCVVAFPHGCTTRGAKAAEASACIAAGTSEIDMVANYGFIRSGMWEEVTADISAVTDVAQPEGVLVKVIMETAFLTLEEIRQATECAIAAKADFVKTSTGFNGDGATEEAVRAMVRAAGGRIQVKASGGIRDRTRTELFISLGATRIGNGYTSTQAICEGAGSGQGAY
jgi:deoxyribose-phosphate aldolase